MKKNCQSCKYWGLNRDVELNGIENVSYLSVGTTSKNFEESFQAYCENEKTRACMKVSETALPGYIKPNIMKWLVTNWTFGCTNWKEAKGWEELWK